MGQSLYTSKDTDDDGVQEYTPITRVVNTPGEISYGDGCNDSVPSNDKKET